MKIHLGFNVTSGDFSSESDQSKFYHRLMEALKHAYSHRIQLGDEKFVDLDKVTILRNNYNIHFFFNIFQKVFRTN